MTDKKVVLVVVAALALALLGAVAGAIYLEAVGRETPALVSDVAKIALGAIAALLARTSVEPDQPVVSTQTTTLYDQDGESVN